ncbi:hypothetical protein [Pseudomonas sp. FEN]|uniref:hypothetical protein n=1 Tax=Pseudomonas sp. FEN TaxID=2767468 RepID=UPI00174C406C|nr:hypothetical protein [Pseudomonas sp. FEN]
MENIAPALVAFTAAVLVGFGSHLVAEDYRRFRDSKAIAAALAGELRSIMLSLPDLYDSLTKMKGLLDNQQKISLPEMPDRPSPIFEANAEKVGLLGVELAGEVSFIYDQIGAFRTSFQLLSKHHTTMDPPWSSLLVGRCIQLIKDNQPKGDPIVEDLKEHSRICYETSRRLG